MAAKKPNLEVAPAARVVADEFIRCLSTPMDETKPRFVEELLAVTRAAAIGGEYRDAIKGYEVLGKILGHVSDTSQHLHLHGNAPGGTYADKTDEELMTLITSASTETTSNRLPPGAVTASMPPELRPEVAQAEAEALLYA